MKSVFAVNATVLGLTLQLAGAAKNLRAHGGHSTNAAILPEAPRTRAHRPAGDTTASSSPAASSSTLNTGTAAPDALEARREHQSIRNKMIKKDCPE